MQQLVSATVARLFDMPRTARLLATSLLILLCTGAHADRIVLLVDNSGSMRLNDVERLVPTGVTRFIESLPEETEVAVVSFDARGRLIQPLIPAGEFNPRVLDRLDYRGPWTDLSLAVERGIYELRQTPAVPGRDAILMITDGVMDTGSPEGDLRAEAWLAGDLTQQLTQRGISMWVVALSEEADFRVLNPITRATGGTYHRAMTANDVGSAMSRIRESILRLDPTPETAPEPRSVPAAAPTARPAATATPAAAPARTAAQPVPQAEPEIVTPTEAPAIAPVATIATVERASESTESAARWWLAASLLLLGAGLLGWALWRTWLVRQPPPKPVISALEYFPDCYLVDLHGVTHASTHPLKGKYNMITRLQQPPDDGIFYIQIFRRQIGRRHALIEYRDFSFWIIDQQSVNGTFLNGKRVTTETRLKHGDRLRFYKYEFEYCVSDLALSNETLIADDTRASF